MPARALSAFLVWTLIAIVGCDRDNTAVQPTANDSRDVVSVADKDMASIEAERCPTPNPVTPQPLVTVGSGQRTLTFWPYTGADFSGAPQDPVNVIFYGKADPRDVRAALMSLDGDRTAYGFPAVAPFNSMWKDAIGDVQVGYGSDCGWVGGVVQLACGDYQPVRFHLRLFRMGDWTVGNVHFEALIPNTTEHQVLSWELAEQFVAVDMMRCGLLDQNTPLTPTGPINDSPFRTIPAMIYNGLPVELRQAIGGPLGDVTDDVPIATDGSAMIFKLARRVPWPTGRFVEDFVINFDQSIPRPFCSTGPADFVYVNGPVHLRQVTVVRRTGEYSFDFIASGALTVTPIDISTGSPSGPSQQAHVRESHSGLLRERFDSAESMKYQIIMSDGALDWSSLYVKLMVDSRGQKFSRNVERCTQ